MEQRASRLPNSRMKILAASIAAVALSGLAGCMGSQATLGADTTGIDWNKVPATKLVLFYPGISSYEWLRSEAHKGAAKETARGDACVSCHDDAKEEQRQGAKIMRGNHPLESVALPGKPGHVDLNVQAAYDDKNAYLRFQWKTAKNKPGVEYPGRIFDGKEWKAYGNQRLAPDVIAGKMPPLYEDRLSVMLDDGKVPGFAAQGCWLTCHDGERNLKQAKKEEVDANSLMKAIKKGDVRKFLPESRNDPSDWKSGKSLDEIAKIKAQGRYLDLFQWRAHRTNPVGGADDGYVLEYRNFDAGKNHFAANWDAEKKQPKFMYDPAKVGSRALVAGAFETNQPFLVKGVNAVPFDPNAGWKAGEILPQYIISAEDAAGSAKDNKGYGTWKDGMWTAVIVRPLNLANPDDKALKAGGVYNVGFAIHDDNMTSRGHYVSYTKTLGLGAKADITAVKLN